MEGNGGDLGIGSSFMDPEMRLRAEETTAVRIDAIDRCPLVRVQDEDAPLSEALTVDVENARDDGLGNGRLLSIGRIGRRCVARWRLSLCLVVPHV